MAEFPKCETTRETSYIPSDSRYVPGTHAWKL